MTATIDFSIREPLAAVVTLRSELRFAPRDLGGRPCYAIEDPIRSKFFRVGIPEATFITCLDGKATIAEAVAHSARVLGANALDEQAALAVCRWLVQAQLATSNETSPNNRPDETTRRSRFHQAKRRFNPLAIKIPLGNPDRLFERLLPWYRWLLGRSFFVGWLAVCCCAVFLVGSRWSDFLASSAIVFDPANWLRMALSWVALKLLHETFHGLVCKKYGGQVVRGGIILIFFTPAAFVDVTSSWRFASRWQRIATSAAGIYVELFAAAVAAIVWHYSEPGLLQRVSFDIAIMGSLNTLLFNGNPLLRFDGYYILSDLLNVPNLYACGRQYLVYLVQRYVLGHDVALPDWPAPMQPVIKLYGVAALLWRVLLYVTLCLMLVGWLSYPGILLSAAFCLFYILIPLAQEFAQLRKLNPPGRSLPRQLSVLCGSASLVFLLAWLIFVRPAMVSAYAVVEYSPLTVLRAASPGFVRSVCVRSGDVVQQGQALVVLENRHLETELADLTLEIEQSALKSQILLQQEDLAKHQVETARRAELEKKRAERVRQVESLTVRAPHPGRIVTRQLHLLKGRYIKAGTEIALIGQESAKELLIAVPQDDLQLFAEQLGSPVRVRFRSGRKALQSRLAAVDPRASLEPPHPALSGRFGGPLPVRQKPAASPGAADTYELLHPMFVGHLKLPADQSVHLKSGETAVVGFTCPAQSFGRRMLGILQSWLRKQIDQAHAE